MEIRGKSGLEAENQKVAGKFRRIQVVGLVCFLFVLVGIHFTIDGKFSVESLVAQATGNPLRSVLWLMLLFAIKSLTIVIPLLSLYVASGILFPPVWAVCVSFLGLAITTTLPYLLGRWSGAEELDYIKAKYPKIDKLVDIQKRNEFFASFIVRLIGWFPCDITSFYFGASRTSYPPLFVLRPPGQRCQRHHQHPLGGRPDGPLLHRLFCFDGGQGLDLGRGYRHCLLF